MITDDEITRALDSADVSNPAVDRLARHPGRGGRVRRTRGLVPYQRGRHAEETWEEAFGARTLAVEGGHLHWSGAVSRQGTPVLSLRGQVRTAYRVAFRAGHGREPVGSVRPGCSYPGCVAGGHLEDQAVREERRRKAAVMFPAERFGIAGLTVTGWRGGAP